MHDVTNHNIVKSALRSEGNVREFYSGLRVVACIQWQHLLFLCLFLCWLYSNGI